MLKMLTRLLWVGFAFLLVACGSATPQPIKAQNPLYLLLVKDQEMSLAVINRPSYSLAGMLPIVNVGNTPPSGDVGILPDGSVVVTHTGASQNGKETVKTDTLVCQPAQGQCSSLIDGWGSATVNTFGQSLAVPIWQADTDYLHGQLAIVSGSPAKIDQRIPLVSLLPGAVHIAPDGKSLYWLTPSGNQPDAATYRLVRSDLAAQTITASYDFGASVPGGLTVAADGTVYTTILYAKQGNRTPGTPPANDPGTQVLVFSPDLHTQHPFTVGAEPLQITLGAGTIAVAYAPNQRHHIDVFSQTDFSLLHSLTSPYPTSIDNLSTLSSGEFAVTVNVGAQTNLGIWDPTSDQITWHSYTGISSGGMAG